MQMDEKVWKFFKAWPKLKATISGLDVPSIIHLHAGSSLQAEVIGPT